MFNNKISTFIAEAVRVLRLTKKPTREEWLTVAKITAIGILLLGAVNYVIESVRWILK